MSNSQIRLGQMWRNNPLAQLYGNTTNGLTILGLPSGDRALRDALVSKEARPVWLNILTEDLDN